MMFAHAALAADPVTVESIAGLFPSMVDGMRRGEVEAVGSSPGGTPESIMASYGREGRWVVVSLGPSRGPLDEAVPGGQTLSIAAHPAAWTTRTASGGETESFALVIVGSTALMVAERSPVRPDAALTVLKALPVDLLAGAFDQWRRPPPSGGLSGFDDPIILGAFDRQHLVGVVAERRAEIAACGRAATGRVVIKFTVSTKGEVSSSAVRSTTVADAAVGECLQAVFLQMRFEPPNGGGIAIVQYPVTFGAR